MGETTGHNGEQRKYEYTSISIIASPLQFLQKVCRLFATRIYPHLTYIRACIIHMCVCVTCLLFTSCLVVEKRVRIHVEHHIVPHMSVSELPDHTTVITID